MQTRDSCFDEESRLLNRRTFIGATAAVLLLPLAVSFAAPKSEAVTASQSAKLKLAKLERELDGRLGIFVLNTANGLTLNYHADERFPLCSTFKVLVAGAILRKSEREMGLLQKRVHYRKGQLVEYSPVTEKHVADGMTVAQLCAAALQYSDNTAANLLLQMRGGPSAVTAFARSIGDSHFRLDRWETALNTAIPGDVRDTSTPAAMGQSLQRLLLGDALRTQQREQLRTWMLGNTTGDSRIKAGIPSDWKIGDKTGSGAYGTANDVAVIWPPKRPPLVVAIYTTRRQKEAEYRSDIIASAAKVIVDWDKAN